MELVIAQGWLLCPVCGRGKVLHLLPGTRAVGLEVYCKRCRQTSVVDIAAPEEPPPWETSEQLT